MKQSVIACLLLGLMAAGPIGRPWAEEPAPEVSLVDLIHGGISTVSKKIESIHEAPGVVSIIERKDIEAMPYETLLDLVKTLPGVTITESFFGYSSLSFRGIKETHYNNRTALLLNGVALRDVIVGTSWLEAVPLAAIERIEIIRGPGSVMYGTGAFAGVINIITRKGRDLAEVAAMAGSKTTVDAGGVFARKLPEIDFLASGSYHESRGYTGQVKDEAGVTAQMGATPKDPDAYENDYYNAFANLRAYGFDLDIFHFRQEKDKFGLIPNHLTAGEAVQAATGEALRYNQDFGTWRLASVLHHTASSYESYIRQFPPAPSGTALLPEYSGYKYGLDVDGDVTLFDKHNLSGGLSYEAQHAYAYLMTEEATGLTSPVSPFQREYDTSDLSAYGQLELKPLDVLKIVGGLRFNQNREYGSTYVPRGSLVFTAASDLFLKFLYGQAYRNPTFFEKYVNTRNVLYGDPDLKPEQIETFELSGDWIMTPRHSLRLTLFSLLTDDLIARARTYRAGDIPTVTLLEDRGVSTLPTANTPGYTNVLGQQIHGLELELSGQLLGDQLGYAVNASYKEGKERADWAPVQFLDQIVAHATLIHRLAGFESALTVEGVGPRRGNIDPSVAAPGFTPGQEVVIPSYALLNLKSTYQVLTGLKAGLVAMNLLGQKVAYPEYIRRRIDQIPGDSGTNVFGYVSYAF